MALSKIKTGGITDSSVTSAKITDGTIVNADVASNAAIAATWEDDEGSNGSLTFIKFPIKSWWAKPYPTLKPAKP